MLKNCSRLTYMQISEGVLMLAKDSIHDRARDGHAARTIEALGVRDYADLVIAMVRADLPFPKPTQMPAHEANVARALLQPRLRRWDAADWMPHEGPDSTLDVVIG